MRLSKRLGLFILLKFCAISTNAQQTVIGADSHTNLLLYEYYNHTQSEWIKLFKIKNFNASLGFLGKGGVSCRMYFVDYQGKGGSYVDFSFPQFISAQQKPVLTLSGSSANDVQWSAYPGSDGPGQEYYDVYVKTPANHVGLSFLIRGSDFNPFFVKSDQPTVAPIWNYAISPQSFNYFTALGNLGLGTLNPTERLSVNGNIRAREIKVETANWPDYVFDNAYLPITLSELERYIKLNKHLPDIPSAAEAEKEGIDLGVMNKKLLLKIEEVTLHLIQKDKEIIELKKQNEQLSAKMDSILNKLKSL